MNTTHALNPMNAKETRHDSLRAAARAPRPWRFDPSLAERPGALAQPAPSAHRARQRDRLRQSVLARCAR